jgi:hypothetical protein
MDQRTLQMIQRGLIAAVSFVLALIVITAFRGLLEPPGETIPRRTTTTTVAEEALGAETTTTTTLPGSATTTTADDANNPAVCVEEEPTSENATLLQLFFPCGSSNLATDGTYIYRTVPETDLVLTNTMREMTRGLDADEEALGFRSPFPEGAEGSFLGVSIDNEEDVAYIEFTDAIFPEGADTAEGAQIFLSTLNANVFQFSTIGAVQYRLGGSCDAFFQRLGGACGTITRSEWLSQQPSP